MWTRLCVDIDDLCNVRGISVECHDADGPTTIWTTSAGPFDDPGSALRQALDWYQQNVGVRPHLF
jgi:hypothetical protein